MCVTPGCAVLVRASGSEYSVHSVQCKAKYYSDRQKLM